MLKSLYIKNYALIDKLEVEFHSGFSVITGETGAGKSIILGALALILGQRADSKSIKSGENKCVIEGIFDVKEYDLKGFCEQNDIEYDDDSVIFRREITSEGKSRAFINDSPVTLSSMKALGDKLIDIHSQHNNLLIGDNNFQLEVLDLLAESSNQLNEFRQAFKEYRNVEKALDKLLHDAKHNKDEEDFIRFQYEALTEANLQDNEQQELEEEQNVLSHSEEIKSALSVVYTLLSEGEQNVVGNLKEALLTIQNLEKIYPSAADFAQRVESAYIDLKDLAPEIEKSAEDIEFSPERMEFITNRLDLIYSLQQKHKVDSIEELKALQQTFKAKLDGIESLEENIKLVQKSLDESRQKMLKSAQLLTDKRLSKKAFIEKTMIGKVASLGMPNVRFECEISPKKFPDMSGGDNLRFMFSANKNVPLQPVSEVASGGEISRVMLCIKSLIASSTNLPTIIFDEIDTGVSGEVADKMGQIMRNFGKGKQVIAITHLPQIASKGDCHYFVYKSDDENSTKTQIKELSEEERTLELAQMMSGSEISEAAIENAKVMLQAHKN